MGAVRTAARAMTIRPSITRAPYDLERAGIDLILAVSSQGHFFIQHPDLLAIWRCRHCGAEWVVNPDANPAKQLRLVSMMPWCPENR